MTRVDQGTAAVVCSGVVCVEGVADAFDLLLGDDNGVGDVVALRIVVACLRKLMRSWSPDLVALDGKPVMMMQVECGEGGSDVACVDNFRSLCP
jgi:hypothetical protein